MTCTSFGTTLIIGTIPRLSLGAMSCRPLCANHRGGCRSGRNTSELGCACIPTAAVSWMRPYWWCASCNYRSSRHLGNLCNSIAIRKRASDILKDAAVGSPKPGADGRRGTGLTAETGPRGPAGAIPSRRILQRACATPAQL